MKNLTGLLLIVLLLIGCEHERELTVKDIPEYLPLKIGNYQVYDVREKKYSSGGTVEELTYELIAQVTDSFPADDNLYTYVVHRSKRLTPADSWQPVDTWSVRRDGGEFVVTEGNTPYVKINLPYYLEKRWNGNAYNTLGEDEYQYSMIHVPRELNGMTFDKTLEVQQEQNDDRIVFRDERKEVYAAGVGLIYKEVIQHHYCTDDPCLGQEKIEHGTEITMLIKDYGKM